MKKAKLHQIQTGQNHQALSAAVLSAEKHQQRFVNTPWLLFSWLMLLMPIASYSLFGCTSLPPEVTEELPKKEVPVVDSIMLPESSWEQYLTWPQVTGFFTSEAHGGRSVRIFFQPQKAAEIYRRNAQLVRFQYGTVLQSYSPGTIILMESFTALKGDNQKKHGPIFIMQKHPTPTPARPAGWEFIILDKPMGSVLARDDDVRVDFCRSCHGRAQKRDYVYYGSK